MRFFWSILLVLALAASVCAQTNTSSAQVPRLVRFSGMLPVADKAATSAGVTFALYAEQTGGSPLWLETQSVAVAADGSYSVLLGAASKDGVPSELFTTNEARWLGVKADGQDEQTRVLLVSVPYALKAGDAETLGGKPASAFILSQSSDSPTSATSTNYQGRQALSSAVSSLATAGTANFIGKFTDATSLGNSTIYEDPATLKIGFGTTTPTEKLELNGNLLLRGQLTHQLQMIGQASQFRLGQNFNGVYLASDTAGKDFRIQTTPNGGSLTTQLIVTPTGSIGIGTTTPGEKFELKGNILLRGNTVHQVQVIGQESSGRLGQASSGFFFASDTPGKRLGFYTTPNGGPLAVRVSIMADGKVGIGTQAPNNALSVAGTIESTTGGFKFPDGSTLTSATSQGTSSFTGNTVNQILAVTQNGTGTAANFTASNASQAVGITQNGAGVAQLVSSGIPAALRGDSTTTSGNAAGVLGTSASYAGYGVLGINLADCPAGPPPDPNPCNSVGTYGWSVNANHGTGVWGEAEATTGDNVGVYGQALGDTGTGVFGYAKNSTALSDGVGVYGQTEAPKGTGVYGLANSASGNTAGLYGVVISNTGVGAQLDVTTGANLIVGRSGTSPTYNNVFRVDSTGKGFFNGGTQNSGADFAESVDVLGGASQYQPGDVMMVDETGVRRFARTTESYSTKIAGIYSTKPGVLGTTHMDGDPRLANEVPLAIVGIVPCKVSAENGPIKAGDLLVSASKPGYAMKGTDRQKMLGAVVGKALGSLDKDTGVIEVLVSLH